MQNNAYGDEIIITTTPTALSAVSLVLNFNLYALVGNTGDVTITLADGNSYRLERDNTTRDFVNIDLADVKLSGTDGDIVIIEGGTGG